MNSKLAGHKNPLLGRPRLPAFWSLFWPYRDTTHRPGPISPLAESAHGDPQTQFPPSLTPLTGDVVPWKYKAVKSLVLMCLREKMDEAEAAGGLADLGQCPPVTDSEERDGKHSSQKEDGTGPIH